MSPSLQRLNVQHSFQIGPTSITFHHSENQDSFLTRIKSELETVEVFPGNPATVLEIEDAFFMPGEVCVYDKGGHRVVDSCIRRGPDLSSFAKTKKEHAVLPQEHDSFEPPIVYLSFLPNHWGHFLTEGVSRLWAFLEYPELRDFDCFFGHANFQNPSFHEFFQSCGIAPDRIKTFDRPVKIKKCYVPLPSINNRNRVFSDHKESLHAVADLMLQGDTPQYSDQAVYLSRSQFRGGPAACFAMRRSWKPLCPPAASALSTRRGLNSKSRYGCSIPIGCSSEAWVPPSTICYFRSFPQTYIHTFCWSMCRT